MLLLLGLLLFLEVAVKPHLDPVDGWISQSTMGLLMVIAFILQIATPAFDDSYKAALLFLTFVPSVALLMVSISRKINMVVLVWERMERKQTLSCWKRPFLWLAQLVTSYCLCCCKSLNRSYPDRRLSAPDHQQSAPRRRLRRLS